MATARDELRRLSESLPDAAVEELADVGRVLERQIAAGEVEDVTDPEEAKIVLGALQDTPDEPELTAEQAKAYLDERRKRGAQSGGGSQISTHCT